MLAIFLALEIWKLVHSGELAHQVDCDRLIAVLLLRQVHDEFACDVALGSTEAQTDEELWMIT